MDIDRNLLDKFIIKEIDINHINDIIEIHKKTMPEYFLSTLGNRFLYLYYKEFVNNKNALALVCIDATKNKVVGYATLMISPGKFYKYLFLKKGIFFGYVLLKHFFRNFKIVYLKKLLQAILYLGKDNTISYAELTSIAILPAYQGKGAGKLLLKSIFKEAKKRGIRRINIGVKKDNTKAIKFYKHFGAIEVGFEEENNVILMDFILE